MLIGMLTARPGLTPGAARPTDARHGDEGENLCVCGMQRAASDVEEILIDSGNQSTARRNDFAPACGFDDTERHGFWKSETKRSGPTARRW